ncbi:endonuclease/exonuclease/phosphatase family protein [Pontibacter sp. 13R65]|uniref:endonuclease/exonuclease/phosphatase family protein n=1 Tax=Pontibacter sp. 13R65 TaxID=3127458 RepID=UPI00301B7CF7
MNRLHMFPWLFIMLALLGACKTNSDDPAPTVEEQGRAKVPYINVMSYNVLQDDPVRPKGYSWAERKDRVMQQIKENNIDILCAQEDYLNQGDDISRATGFYKTGVSRNTGNATGSGEFVAIYYNKNRFTLQKWGRFWMSETPDVPSRSWDARVLRICNWAKFKDANTNKEFYVFNTHLDHIGSEARLKSAELLKAKIAEIAEGKPVILAGDMNATPETAPIRVLNNFMFDSREVSEKYPSGPIGTYNAMDINKPLNRRIDYIFVNNLFRVLEYSVLNETKDNIYPSDHLPVLARVEQK